MAGGCDNNSSTSMTSNNSKSKKLYTFVEARKIARGHGFSSKQEFLDYDCPGAYQIPKDADVVWSDDGWNGWDDFLGIPYDFEMGRQLARSMKIPNREAYLDKFASKNKASLTPDEERLPYRPDLYYKNSGWISWEDWLQGDDST